MVTRGSTLALGREEIRDVTKVRKNITQVKKNEEGREKRKLIRNRHAMRDTQ